MTEDEVGYITFRGVDGYADAFGLKTKDFLRWIAKKKRVLDVGSGGALLKREIEILKGTKRFKSSVEIFSFDIAYGKSRPLSRGNYPTEFAFTHLGHSPRHGEADDIEEKFRKTAVGGSFFSLPFGDNEFDVVLAVYSFGVHSRNIDELRAAMGESYRVLKPRGMAYISIGYDEESGTCFSGGADVGFSYNLRDISDYSPTLKTRRGQANATKHYITIKKD